MPFRRISLKAIKPEILADQGDSLAAHLRRARRERGLKQIEVAAIMGVSERSIVDWEAGKQPLVGMYRAIIAFLGYEPWLEPVTLAEKLIAERRRRGFSAKLAAMMLGVDEGTLGRWEHGKPPSCPTHQALIVGFLGLKNDA